MLVRGCGLRAGLQGRPQPPEVEQRLSMRQQADSIRATCKAKDWELLTLHEDFALSGTGDVDLRPGFANVADLMDSRSADVGVVRHVDRLFRKAWRLLQLVDDPIMVGTAGTSTW
ncbi:hypothetical protein EUA93_12665 [Nocardioides oleivorans]|uniref:Resolvase/invertase-type recombinase catalytic domain-containing protein n=1 Tax=Nocardioides oleivorans TaxID=273676 RepID=A0A4Q2S0I1_9ACTN|nr:recombinase family protein [Nocardioides oleivorans]RYB95121.1 hypothetical protein EUA93_12665 [Nocardioides oleivorans]